MVFEKHYVIKENDLFPVLEEYWPDFRCLQVMWSLHDDIRSNLKQILLLLESDDFKLKQFNHLSGEQFFNMLAIKFREECILFPKIPSSQFL